jgi:phenylpyruvate tautomerase PptA (4-oxalocrotonate tautomerase family)
MPHARIDLAEGKTADYRRTIGEVVYDAVVEVLKAPKDDRFITEEVVKGPGRGRISTEATERRSRRS